VVAVIMMLRKLWLALLVALLIQNDVATANRCFMHGSVTEEFKIATAVFSGKVIAEEYRPVGTSAGQPQGSEVLIVRIVVDRYWKGDVGKEVEMYTSVTRLPGGMIQMYAEDYHFEVGKEYLVYAFGPQDQLRTDVCKRTVKIGQAKEDLRELGKGKVPK
jgi:hypothetical protein